MGKRTQYTPGTFSWTDLTTTDQEAAKAFYGALFGWEATDSPAGDGSYYTMMRLDGEAVGAVVAQPQQQREAGVPPTWNSYITVQNADETLARARELGANVHADAFDIMDAGRMAVIQDPQGAYFLLWQPQAHIGAGLVNAPGALSWNELASPDLDLSGRFYGDLFGWTTEALADSEIPYHVIKTEAGQTNGGMRPPMPPGTPPHWLVYFGTEDIDVALARVSELGGTKLMGPMALATGKIGVVRDPQGAVFALYAGMFED